MKVSFTGYGENVLTFEAENSVAEGIPVKISANGTVGVCAPGDAFCGVAVNVRNGFAGVQLKGFVTLPYTGTVALGQQVLAADTDGKVKTGTAGVTALVVDIDETAQKIGIIL